MRIKNLLEYDGGTRDELGAGAVPLTGSDEPISRDGRSVATVEELRWYARAEVAGPWRVALCAEHAAVLASYRFERIETPADRKARVCAVCAKPDLLRVVESCTCETDAGRCPEHSNLGCSC